MTEQIKYLYLSNLSHKEAKKKIDNMDSFFIVDIAKIIRDLGYVDREITKESEFIINYTIQKKIAQGIYSIRCDSILVCYKKMSDEFVENFKNYINELTNDENYTIVYL